MAEMMEVLQRKLEFAFLGSRFWIFAEVGAIFLLLLTFKPYFAPYNVTALIVMACAVTWDLWRNAPKSARYGLSLTVLGAFVFLLYNTLGVSYGWWPAFEHPLASVALVQLVDGVVAVGAGDTMGAVTGLGGATQSIFVVALAYAIGGIANLFFLVSGLMGLMAARKA